MEYAYDEIQATKGYRDVQDIIDELGDVKIGKNMDEMIFEEILNQYHTFKEVRKATAQAMKTIGKGNRRPYRILDLAMHYAGCSPAQKSAINAWVDQVKDMEEENGGRLRTKDLPEVECGVFGTMAFLHDYVEVLNTKRFRFDIELCEQWVEKNYPHLKHNNSAGYSKKKINMAAPERSQFESGSEKSYSAPTRTPKPGSKWGRSKDLLSQDDDYKPEPEHQVHKGAEQESAHQSYASVKPTKPTRPGSKWGKSKELLNSFEKDDNQLTSETTSQTSFSSRKSGGKWLLEPLENDSNVSLPSETSFDSKKDRNWGKNEEPTTRYDQEENSNGPKGEPSDKKHTTDSKESANDHLSIDNPQPVEHKKKSAKKGSKWGRSTEFLNSFDNEKKVTRKIEEVTQEIDEGDKKAEEIAANKPNEAKIVQYRYPIYTNQNP
ncbi:unnamed protein product [Ambrosiozyma monospora]|uniref:Unnamed protein product n=1 Tax=Ambrosiozyma monospora TaxID=43982 RepID=A0A9W7DIW7_AMBMO|nr:unnamed protein product [Ambrosiozyma monospora]